MEIKKIVRVGAGVLAAAYCLWSFIMIQQVAWRQDLVFDLGTVTANQQPRDDTKLFLISRGYDVRADPQNGDRDIVGRSSAFSQMFSRRYFGVLEYENGVPVHFHLESASGTL